MKNCIFLCGLLLIGISSCSNDDSIIKTEDQIAIETKNLIELNFIPTFENYFGRDNGSTTYRSASLAVEWEHQYDEKGRLVNSKMYEMYPYRRLKEISFSDYSTNNLEVKIKVNWYNYFATFPQVSEEKSSLSLNENFSLKSIAKEEGRELLSFDELNSGKWATKLGLKVSNGTLLWTTNYEYDENGNVTRYYTTYHQYEMTEAVVDYTYTDWGDPLSYNFKVAKNKFSIVDYFYRGDNTLERLEENFDYGDENAGKNIYSYNESEAFLQQITNYNNGSKITIDFNHDVGEITRKNYLEDGKISEIYYYLVVTDEERYYLSTHEKYLNGLLDFIKYFNSENIIEKQEYYDDTGNLEYTEYYDEDGNLTDTIYA